MDEVRLTELLEALQAGQVPVAETLAAVRGLLAADEMTYAHLDHYRARRTGVPEVVYCEGKTTEQVVGIMGSLLASSGRVLATRASAEKAAAVMAAFPDAQYHSLSRVICIDRQPQPVLAPGAPYVAVATAGTSDLPVAEEAALTLEFLGDAVQRTYDVGVAGLHRLLGRREVLMKARVVIAVAGMEGALASVIGGMVQGPVVAVPTSVGYGASFGGLAALLAMLNSCAPGVAVVNIDNGFGAAVHAHQIMRGSCG
ncbi:MAG TPA: nickel pincer cofactor biosynthesis protein LarB [Anaerolineae bacterium]